MFPLKRALLVLSAAALAACGDDRSVNPIAEFVDGSSAAITTGGTLVAQYTLQVGQSVKINPKTTTRTNRLKWSSSNATVASVNSQGTVTAKTTGSATVQVSGNGVLENYAVTVSAPAAPSVTSFSLQPKMGVSLTSGQSQQFAASATWSDGMQYPITVSYTATGGTISGTGLFTAGNLAGTFMVVATCACTSPAIADTAFVNITAPQLTKLTITPKTVSLAAGASQQFGVTASWSTGATTVPPVTWSANGGTVSSTGAYVAPSAAGTYQVIVAHTNGTVRDTAVVTVAATVGSSFPTSPWSITRDFNTGNIGSVAQRTSDGFDDAAGKSIYSLDQSVDGTKSARLTIDSGATGFGNWGGIINFPSRLVAGDELWLQLEAYFPDDFVIRTDPAHLKFLRVRTYSATGGNTGYNDLYIPDDATTGQQFKFIQEVQGQWFWFGASKSLVRSRWHRFTVHYRFDTVAKSLGGKSQVRIWQNGQLVLDETRIRTLVNATDYANSFYLFTYWNGPAPKTQSVWVDNIRMANRMPDWAANLPSVNNY